MPERAGRDSSLVMLTPFLASGTSRSCTAPGRFAADITSEVLSLPEGATFWLPRTRKRVVLLASSSIFSTHQDERVWNDLKNNAIGRQVITAPDQLHASALLAT